LAVHLINLSRQTAFSLQIHHNRPSIKPISTAPCNMIEKYISEGSQSVLKQKVDDD